MGNRSCDPQEQPPRAKGIMPSSRLHQNADLIPRLSQMQVEAQMLLIIENQTPFEILVQLEHRNPRTLYLCGLDFPGQAQRELTAFWLRARPTIN